MPLEQIIVQLNPDVPPTGSDLGIVNAARRSFAKRSELQPDGTLKPADVSLLKFLARGMQSKDFDEFVDAVARKGYLVKENVGHDYLVPPLIDLLWMWRNTPTHDTPTNHGFFSFEVQAPIFVRAQLVKHEYLILSEYSRRYITDGIEFYLHDYREASKDKKQGSGGLHGDNSGWQDDVTVANMRQLELYQRMIDEGIAPEQARGVLPQDLMTSWTWSGTFGAFVKMCQLRLGTDAQRETRYVAQQVYGFLAQQFPVSTPLFVHGY